MSLQVIGLRKSYSGFQVLRGVDLRVAPGTVHALLGANGAGKSTLIKCVGGVTPPDAGSLVLDGAKLTALTPQSAFDQGIATIHQHPTMVDSLSVSDNIFLGSEKRRFGLRCRAAQRAETEKLLERFQIDVTPGTVVGRLPIGTRQLLEIAKAWHRTEVRVLILDEPTASLSGRETEQLFVEMEKLKERGVCIIYTTHRLAEVFRVADYVSVLRDGQVVVQGPRGELDSHDIVRGISRGTVSARAKGVAEAGEIVLKARALAGPRFGPLDLDVRAGEVLGIYGALGSGRTSLLETIAGAFRRSSGAIELAGQPVQLRSPREAIGAGIALVPADRNKQALFGTRAAAENLLSPSYRHLSRFGARRPREERRTFQETARGVDLHPPDPRRPAESFSGGNQQKIVLGRWTAMTDRLNLLMLDEPTQGVDVGARSQLYSVLRELAAQRRCAIVFSSAEAEEIVALADRAVVLHEGRLVAEFAGQQITEVALIDAAHQFIPTDSSHHSVEEQA